MRLIFLGSRKVGYLGLEELIRQKHDILAVFTFDWDITEGYPAAAYKKLCQKNKIPFYQTNNIETAGFYQFFEKAKPDLLASIYWRPLISSKILNTARLGGVNTHNSLLPRYQGWAPLNWAIINGEKKAGVTLHYMVANADQGDIIGQIAFPILEHDSMVELSEKAVTAGVKLIKKFIPMIEKGKAPRKKQDPKKFHYSYARLPIDSLIDWQKSALEIDRLIRASAHPYPGAYTYYQKKKIFIWKASVLKGHNFIGIPGHLIRLRGKFCVLTAKELLCLNSVQFEGEQEGPAEKIIKKAVRLSSRQ